MGFDSFSDAIGFPSKELSGALLFEGAYQDLQKEQLRLSEKLIPESVPAEDKYLKEQNLKYSLVVADEIFSGSESQKLPLYSLLVLNASQMNDRAGKIEHLNNQIRVLTEIHGPDDCRLIEPLKELAKTTRVGGDSFDIRDAEKIEQRVWRLQVLNESKSVIFKQASNIWSNEVTLVRSAQVIAEDFERAGQSTAAAQLKSLAVHFDQLPSADAKMRVSQIMVDIAYGANSEESTLAHISHGKALSPFDPVKAQLEFQDAIDGMNASLRGDDITMVRALRELAAVFETYGQRDKAEQLRERSRCVQERLNIEQRLMSTGLCIDATGNSSLAAMSDLAAFEEKQGNLSAAERFRLLSVRLSDRGVLMRPLDQGSWMLVRKSVEAVIEYLKENHRESEIEPWDKKLNEANETIAELANR